jgi:soluble lytic murein transglycosylase-like protein
MVGIGMLAAGLVPAAARAQAVCEQAAAAAEQAWRLPSGLLLAIGRVESGKWDPALRRTVPWPWSIDAAGQGQQFASAMDAVQAVRTLLDGGARNVDVGCFQINLQSHPDAFASLEQALDPTANALYAARFLSGLHDRLGRWEDAVAAYHSANPILGVPYQQAVYAGWANPTEPAVYSFHIWTPSAPGTASGVVVIKVTNQRLPTVQVGSLPRR